VALDNTARDHRLRLLFPVGAGEVTASTTFDAVVRQPGLPDDTGWMQPAQATFVHQGWVSAAGLTVVAPDLPEAELGEDGTLALTLVRAVGWLSGMDLHTRPVPAGPGMPTPGAQCLGRFHTTLHVSAGGGATAARDAELGMWAVAAGSEPLVEPGAALLEIEPRSLLLSAVKPAEDGEGMVVRVINTGDDPEEAVLRFGIPIGAAVLTRPDEDPLEDDVAVEGATVTFPVRAHGIVTVMVT
jgi:mannosylglycerate hydrolase